MNTRMIPLVACLVVVLPTAWACGQYVIAPAPVVVHRPVVPVAPAPVVVHRPVVPVAPAPSVVHSPITVAPAASPVIVRSTVYVPGQPIRNLLRAITP